MNNSIAIAAEFNRDKNIKATLYTVGVAIALLLFVWIKKFYEPVVPPPQQDEFIEINLGSSDVGSGNSQPEIPGEPAPQQQSSYTPPQPSNTAQEESAKDVEESNRADDPPVRKPAATKPDAKDYKETKTVKTTATPTSYPPAPPQPRAVMGQVRGGSGNGGNGASTYKPGTGEGPGDGPGDKGSIGGNPNGKDYTPKRITTVKVANIQDKNFQDDFTHSGVVVLDVYVDANGKVTGLVFQPRGSTLSDRKEIEIAKRRAYELTYSKYPEGSIQPTKFQFQVKN